MVLALFTLLVFCLSEDVVLALIPRHFQKSIGVDPGPWVLPTQGAVWPKPQQQRSFEDVLTVRPKSFEFSIVNEKCDILEEAISRYSQTIRKQHRQYIRIMRSMKQGKNNALEKSGKTHGWHKEAGNLNSLEIALLAPCESLPYLHMDEHYELRINTPDLPQRAMLTSQSIWGILRGLETFSQLLYLSSGTATVVINSTLIMDFPRFPHRGLHLDTARHFQPLRLVHQYLDAMEMNKYNVFHWHLTDDQSFPFESKVFPKLTELGAYTPLHVYTQEQIREVIEYARLRGIRVVPEFDTPGHTRSWGQGHPELLTQCYQGDTLDGSLGPVNPIVESTYDFMRTLLIEIKNLFPDPYIHLGGDEVPFDCWISNPEISKFMDDHNLNITGLEEMYIQRMIDIVQNISGKPLVWQEVFDNGVEVQEGTIVHVWKVGDHESELAAVTRKGHLTLLSSCWYLDHLSSGGDWRKFYDCDPHFFEGTEAQRRLVLGGEACMWTEFVDANNLMSRVWPRACAAAEKLWSRGDADDPNEAAKRLEEHNCRMNQRGIPSQPANGPGFCWGSNFA